MKDKQKKLYKLIIILLICIALVLILKVIFEKVSNKDSINDIEIVEGAFDFDLNEVKKVQSRSDYCLVKKCIEKFYNYYINDKDVYNLLDNEYIEIFSIEKEALQGKYGDFKEAKVDIKNMYFVETGVGINTYFAYGYLIEESTNKVTDLSIGIKIDMGHSTFSILPYEYLEKNEYLNVKEGTKISLKEETEIENKSTNTFKYKYVNDYAYMDYLFDNYIDRCLYNTELIYNCLAEEYRNKHFDSFDKFKQYIEKNREKYMSVGELYNYDEIDIMYENISDFSLEIKSYNKTVEKDYTQYTCVDNLKNYYIFRETAPMEYSLILDLYTIDLPEFIEKYEKATIEEKVGYNIEKIVNALNMQDYNYIYSKLAEEFKTKYFKTYEEFEEYAKDTFDIGNEVTYNRYTESQNLSSYQITLEGKYITVTKTIVMRLEEGTDFVMSFNVE